MPEIVTQEPCTICQQSFSIMHSHHTIPQARGGVDSLQIILCGNCHNILHANAVYVVSRLRNPKRPAQEFWPTDADRRRAEPWLQILVKALIVPNEEAAAITEHPVGTKLSAEDFRLFKLLAQDLGCSQENAVAYCIKHTLKQRGFTNEKTKPELWFLPVPKQRQDF